ncbi:MAG: ATP-binding protein [Acholeplasmataceae bacterium]|nr:ATP-binding protein [Acholeplasmataceae bacterium]
MFLGREKELKMLENLLKSNDFEFGVIHGRRRVGKTTLLKQAIIGKRSLYLLAQQANAKTNLDLFSKRYGELIGAGQMTYNSFYDFFEALMQEDNLVVVLDEFTYLTEVDRSLESVLQGLIDAYKDTSNIKLIISGSEIGMFEQHFSMNKPLFNRQTWVYQLKECDYYESSRYYPNFTSADKVRAYAVFGGLPYYLAHIDDQKSLEQNIKNLIANENARFSNEVNMLLISELRSIQEYQSILQAIQSGRTKLSEIDSKSKINDTAKTSKYVKKLMELEIIEKEFKFMENPNSRNHLYRIKNNFIAFHYHFMWKNSAARVLMDEDDYYDAYIRGKLDHYVSLRFEKIGEQYLIRKYKYRNSEPMIGIGRYWYNDHQTRTDVEIDLCVQTHNHVHVYECKWTNDLIGESVMRTLAEKGKSINASKFGAFSKNGYQSNIEHEGYDLITIEDLYEE